MGILTDGVFHLLVHTTYFMQYLLLTVATIFGLIWFQFYERKITGTWSSFFSSHFVLHFLLVIYNLIQVFRNAMGILNDPWNISAATFFYYIKDGFSISVLLVILYIYMVNIFEETGRKILKILFSIISLVTLIITLIFAIIKVSTTVSLYKFIIGN